jgi:choline dehydrogenase
MLKLSGFVWAFALARVALAAPQEVQDEAEFEYIVVGTGPGGAPLAADLARAGHSVLVLEAGDDQMNLNILKTSYLFNSATNNNSSRWDFFVRHSDDERENLKYKHMTYRKPDGDFYVGTQPPADAERLGVWYPRAGTLGGCAMVNAGLLELPPDWAFDDISEMFGDKSWRTNNMRKYYTSIENCNTPRFAKKDHGYGGWLDSKCADGSWIGNMSDGEHVLTSAARELGARKPTHDFLKGLLATDPNADMPGRDRKNGIVPMVTHANNASQRAGPGYYLRQTYDDPTSYPVTVSFNSLATKILFDKKSKTPKAVGVEYLKGQSLYRADPRHNGQKGKKMRAFASREVIVAGGVFNSPQILLLSGIGPAAHLKELGIPVVKNLAGVGGHLVDNYEGSVIALANRDFKTAGGKFAAHLTTSAAIRKERDIYMW